MSAADCGVSDAGVNFDVRPPKSPEPFGSPRTQSPSSRSNPFRVSELVCAEGRTAAANTTARIPAVTHAAFISHLAAVPISFRVGLERRWIPDERSARFVVRIALKRRGRFVRGRQAVVVELVRLRRGEYRWIRPGERHREHIAVADKAIALDKVGLISLEPTARD